MNTKAQIFILIAVLLLAGLPSGCAGIGAPLDQKDVDRIEQQIRQEIEKTYPLPETGTIKTHVGDNVTFSTRLGMDEVVAFYRTAYAGLQFSESPDSRVSAGNASLVFQKAGEKDVLVDVIALETSCAVHLRMK